MPRPFAVSESLIAGQPTSADRLAQFRCMLQARQFEERLRSLYRQGRIPGGVYLGLGQEALSAAAGLSLQEGDVYAPLIRDMGGRVAFGENLLDALRHCMGKATAPMRGRDGNIHRGDVAIGLLPMISHLGAMVSVVAGMLLARRLSGRPMGVGLATIGDGGMNTGAVHEALNAAAVQRLPLVLLVANNGFAYSTPNHESSLCEDLADRAPGYGVAAYRCDGTDPAASLATIAAAVAAAREGGGCQLVVARLLRLCGHGEHDDARYITPEIRARYADCLDRGHEQILGDGLATQADIDLWRADFEAELDRLVDQIVPEPDPDPAAETWSAYHGSWPFPATREVEA